MVYCEFVVSVSPCTDSTETAFQTVVRLESGDSTGSPAYSESVRTANPVVVKTLWTPTVTTSRSASTLCNTPPRIAPAVTRSRTRERARSAVRRHARHESPVSAAPNNNVAALVRANTMVVFVEYARREGSPERAERVYQYLRRNGGDATGERIADIDYQGKSISRSSDRGTPWEPSGTARSATSGLTSSLHFPEHLANAKNASPASAPTASIRTPAAARPGWGRSRTAATPLPPARSYLTPEGRGIDGETRFHETTGRLRAAVHKPISAIQNPIQWSHSLRPAVRLSCFGIA